MNNSKTISATQEMRRILKVVDFTFGSFTSLFILVFAFNYFLTGKGGAAVVSIILFVTFNLLISQTSLRVKNPRCAEVFRQVFALCVLCPYSLHAAKEVMSPFWYLYLIMVVSSNSLLYEATSKKIYSVLATILGILSYIVSSYYLLSNPIWTEVAIQCLTMIMFIVLFTKFISLIKNSYELEVDRSLELQRTMNELKRAQETMIYSSRMSAIGEMAGGIAHEINNPLAIINGSIFQLKKIKINDRELDENIKEIANRISETVSRITKIILSLKTVSRDSSETNKDLISLQSIINDATVICSEKFKAHGVELIIDEYFYSEASLIYADHVQLSQVLINLLSNAYDAVENEENPWIKIETSVDNEYQIIKVTDSGNGIPREVQDKMFEPFYTSKEVGKGTGLGLSISKGLIEKNDGELTIDNNSPHTCFVIRIPKG